METATSKVATATIQSQTLKIDHLQPPTIPKMRALWLNFISRNQYFISNGMDTGKDMTSFGKPIKPSFNDKLFLLNFIMCTYLGPDVYSDRPRCSWFERFARSSPPYESNSLGTSFLRVSHLQRLYYHVLRNANSDLVFEPNVFYMYLKGVLLLPSSGSVDDYRQFTSFFPTSLHIHKKFANCEVVKGIVLIDDPDTAYFKAEDLERFKHLSGVEDFSIDRHEIRGIPRELVTSEDDTESESSSNSDEEREKGISELQDVSSSESTTMTKEDSRKQRIDGPSEDSTP